MRMETIKKIKDGEELVVFRRLMHSTGKIQVGFLKGNDTIATYGNQESLDRARTIANELEPDQPLLLEVEASADRITGGACGDILFSPKVGIHNIPLIIVRDPKGCMYLWINGTHKSLADGLRVFTCHLPERQNP